MLQNVNTVLVGATTAAPDSGTGATAVYAANYNTVAEFNAGEVFLVDEKMNLIATNAEAVAAKEVRFALKTADTTEVVAQDGTVATTNIIKYSAPIKRNSIKKAVYNVYAAPTEDKIVFDFDTFTPEVGRRYVVRFIYRDLYEHPGQFTKSYEVIATTTSLNDLLQALKARINKDMTRRINVITTTDIDETTDVTSAAVKLIATAKAKNDNEGKESINIYTQVSMTAVMWYTYPSATGFASKVKYQVPGLEITKTAGGPGKGYWKAVRDREQAALAYKGITYRTTWPYSLLKPTLKVSESGTYNSLIVEFENQYLTPDNQVNSHTKQAVEIYVDGTLAGSVLAARFDAFNV